MVLNTLKLKLKYNPLQSIKDLGLECPTLFSQPYILMCNTAYVPVSCQPNAEPSVISSYTSMVLI